MDSEGSHETKRIVWSAVLTTTKFEISCIIKINILLVHLVYINTSIFLLVRLARYLELTNIRFSRNFILNGASSSFVLENKFNDL